MTLVIGLSETGKCSQTVWIVIFGILCSIIGREKFGCIMYQKAFNNTFQLT